MSMPIDSSDHEPPASPAPEDNRLAIALIPFALAAIALTVAVCGFFAISWSRNVGSILFGVAGAVLIFDVPVCFCVLVDWIRTGQPPELHLSPLISCREEREFHRRLRERPKLDDDEFFKTHFASMNVPRDVPLRLRRLLEDVTGLDLDAIHPDDNLIWADLDLDFADVLYRIEREFGVAIPIEGFTQDDCKFSSLVRRIAERYPGKP